MSVLGPNFSKLLRSKEYDNVICRIVETKRTFGPGREVMSQHLFVNVSGGSLLAIEMKRRLEAGENKIRVGNLGPDTDFGSIDLVERGGTRFGSLDLVKAEMPRDARGRLSKTKS